MRLRCISRRISTSIVCSNSRGEDECDGRDEGPLNGAGAAIEAKRIADIGERRRAPPIATRMREALGPWAVSGPAIAIASRALADKAWLVDTVKRLRADVDRLDRLIGQCGWETLGGTPLFRLVRTGDPHAFVRLANRGILVRPFAERPDCIRVGLPDRKIGVYCRTACAALCGLDRPGFLELTNVSPCRMRPTPPAG